MTHGKQPQLTAATGADRGREKRPGGNSSGMTEGSNREREQLQYPCYQHPSLAVTVTETAIPE